MNDLPTCSKCGRRHLPVATRCPHCGHAFFRDPYEDTTYEPRSHLRTVILVSAVLVTAAGVGLWAVSREGPLGPSVRLSRDRPVPERAETPAATVPTAPETTAAITAAPPPEQEAPPAAQPPTAPPQGTTPRWASTWANVRETPDLSAAVVSILDPGERVDVGERAAGYWRVYVDGRPVGYVAGSLLLREPPAGQ